MCADSIHMSTKISTFSLSSSMSRLHAEYYINSIYFCCWDAALFEYTTVFSLYTSVKQGEASCLPGMKIMQQIALTRIILCVCQCTLKQISVFLCFYFCLLFIVAPLNILYCCKFSNGTVFFSELMLYEMRFYLLWKVFIWKEFIHIDIHTHIYINFRLLRLLTLFKTEPFYSVKNKSNFIFFHMAVQLCLEHLLQLQLFLSQFSSHGSWVFRKSDKCVFSVSLEEVCLQK